MKTETPPPQENSEIPFQQLGWLHIQKGTIILMVVKHCGVEMILSNGLSICVPSGEIIMNRLKSNNQFAHCLQLGANFPKLKMNIQATRDFIPRWADEMNESERLQEYAEAAAKYFRPKTEARKPDQEPPAALPLPPTPPPERRGSGDGGMSI